MGPVYEHFKFQIGQLVQQRVSAGFDCRMMIVIERVYQQCPGGVQLHYKCRPHREIVQQFLELELEEYVPDKVMADDDIKEMMLASAERRRHREQAAKKRQYETKPADEQE